MVASRSAIEHRADIQGLRALAVLLVIADHAHVAWLRGGFVGVDVFFVISGYLITRLLVAEAEATTRVRIGEFYARRARRILPAATLVLLVTMAYAARELSVTRVQQLRDDSVWSALFAANIHNARLGTDYFAQGREASPFEHYWSLAVEEQFYLLWPLLLAVVVAVVARRGRSSSALASVLTWLLAAIVVISLTWSVFRTQAAPVSAYYSSTARAWELAVGALIAVHQARAAGLGRRSRAWLTCAGLLALGVAVVGYDAGSAFPGWRALLPVLGTAALVIAGTADNSGMSRVLGLAPLAWLGALSYSLYLWHWPILVLGRDVTAEMGETRATAVLLAVTLAAAILTYHLVENPLRHSGLLRPGRRSLVLWPVALGAVLLGVSGAEREATSRLQERMAGGQASSLPGADPREAPGGPTSTAGNPPGTPPVVEPSLVDRLNEALRIADTRAAVPFPLTNLPGKRKDMFQLPMSCLAAPQETTTKVCPAGLPDAQQTMVVFGDSQANQWMPALDLIGRREQLRVLPVIKLGCPPFDVPVVDGGGADFWQCTDFREWAADYIAKVQPEIVVIGSEATSYRKRAAPGLDLDQTWARGVEKLLARLLQPLGTRVVVLADTPDFGFDPVDCLTDPDSRLDACIGTPHEGLDEANAITRQVARDVGAGYVDTIALLCAHRRCPLVVDRTMTFVDYSHVSPTWAAALVDDFDRALIAALRETAAAM